jgi:hypothetical protein
MAAVLTIGGVQVTFIEDTLDVQKQLDERQRLQCDVFDETGTLHFQKGDQVLLSDPAIGTVYSGFINSDKEVPVYPTGAILHTIDCVDLRYLADKRTFTRSYTTSTYAGKIVVDAIENVLLDEGIQKNYALHTDTTAADFNTGTKVTTAGYDVASGDGQLELQRAGTNLNIIEDTITDFSAGTLTNMTANSNGITPTTVNALKMQSTLSFAFGTEFAQEQQSANGTVAGSPSGTASGSFSTNVNSSGSFNTSVFSSGSVTPSGSVNISGGAPGESASFSGFSSSVSVSGTASSSVNSSGTAAATVNSSVSTSFSSSCNLSVSKQYHPKTKGKVKVDKNHYAVITVDRAVADNRVDAVIWTGSQVVGSNDKLIYDVWIASTSPSEEAGVDLFFSDGTQLTEYLGSQGTNNDVGIWDQNLVSISPIQNLADYAGDTWYNRQVNLAPLSGKTVIAVSIFNAGNIAGTFDYYVKNCYLNSHSGSKFFSTTQTTPTTNPPAVSSIGAYISNATIVTVQSVYDPAVSSRISPAYSIDSVKLVKDSMITWVASNPLNGPSVVEGDPGTSTTASSMAIFVSYDATTWLPCTNNKAIPGLPAGANISGMSLYLLETFSGGQDPTAIPTLASVNITINSAPKATITDITQAYGTSTTWNTGTELGAAPNANGDLTLGTTSYTWSNLNNMTFVPGNTGVSNPSQSVSSGVYQISSPGNSSSTSWSSTRFNFIAAAQDFTAEADFTLNSSSPNQNEVGFVYRQTYWDSPNNSFAYYVRVMQAPGGQAGGTSITLGYGINSPPQNSPAGGGPATGTFTVITQISKTISNNTTYHVKLVVSGSRHTIYWNGSSTASIDVLDDTYTAPGNIGIRTYYDASGSSTATAKIANFSVTNTFAGLWTSPSINLNSLGTVGNAQIAWGEINAAGKIQSTAIINASLDGGTIWTQCTNAAVSQSSIIPILQPGTSVVGKSLKIQIVLSGNGFLNSPIIRGLYLHICGAYPTVSGTRSTAPLGNDLMIRPNQLGWGTAFDGQAWVKVGSGTDAIAVDEATITNTIGDVHELLGSMTWLDEDATVRFNLSTSTIAAGIELRYIDTNNFYRLYINSTTINVVKVQGGLTFILKTGTVALSTGVYYRMRYRVVGSTPGATFHYGEVWPDQTLEPIISNSNSWTIIAQE